MLKQRVIFGVIGAVFAILLLYFASVSIIGAILGIISLIALYEFYGVTNIIKKNFIFALTGFVFSVLATYGVVKYDIGALLYLPFALIGYIFISMILMVFTHKKSTFSENSAAFMGTLYISIFFMHMLLIRQLEMGKILIWVLFICAWSTDTFAYFAGRFFGKHKLCPNVSPKKTVEGAIGGILGSVVCTFLYVYIISKVNNFGANYMYALILSIVASVFSQLGDLSASCIKRDNNAKDYGHLIPGHGGILDRFDSCLLIAPLVYYILLYFPILIK